MRKFTITILLTTVHFGLMAQLTFESDPFFDQTDTNNVFKGESTVMLAKRNHFIVEPRGDTIYSRWESRFKLYFHDKVDVDEYSTFSLNENDEILLRVIKPSGEIIVIDESEAIEVEGEQLMSALDGDAINFNLAESKRKIAIPYLEAGDVLEYILITTYEDERKNNARFLRSIFSPASLYEEVNNASFSLANSYSTIQYELIVDIPEDYYINARSYRTSGNFEERPAELEGQKRFVFNEAEIKKSQEVHYMYDQREEPWVKFAIWQMPATYVNKARDLHGKNPGIIYSHPTLEDLTTFVLKEQRRLVKDSELTNSFEQFRYAHYYNINRIRQKGTNADKAISYYRLLKFHLSMGENEEYSIDPWEFIALMEIGLKYLNIPFEVVVTVPKNEGNLEELLTKNDLSVAIRVEGENGWKYLFPFAFFSNEKDMNYQMAGQKGIAIKSGSNSPSGRKLIEIPEYVATDNIYREEIGVNFTADDRPTSLAYRTFMKGEYRTHNSDWALTLFDFRKNLSEITDYRLSNYLEDLEPLLDRRRIEERKEVYDKYFDLKTFHSFEVEDPGIQIAGWMERAEEENEWLIVTEEFEVNDLVKRVADSLYILELGRLLQNETRLDPKDRSRMVDVYIGYPYQIQYEINFMIPARLEIDDLNAFNIEVENSTGFYKSEMIPAPNGIVQLKIIKSFIKGNYDKSKWEELMEIMDAGDRLRNMNIVFGPAD